MKKALQLFILFLGLTLSAQVESDITAALQYSCTGFSECADYQIGSCPGDTYSDGSLVPDIYTTFNVWYVTEDIDLDYAQLIIRNGRLEFRNGASLIDNGILVDVQTDCDLENTTEIVFLGGGQRFANMDDFNEWQQTLSLDDLEQFKKKANRTYYTISGKALKTLENSANGIYIIEYSLGNRLEREKYIKIN